MHGSITYREASGRVCTGAVILIQRFGSTGVSREWSQDSSRRTDSSTQCIQYTTAPTEVGGAVDARGGALR
jgi:hypothetical protein